MYFQGQVLVVGQSDKRGQRLQRALVDFGLRVALCTQLSDTIEFVKRRPVDIVFINNGSPELDPPVVAAKIREIENRADLPIVTFSDGDSIESRRILRSSGIDLYLPTLLSTSLLQNLLSFWLKGRST